MLLHFWYKPKNTSVNAGISLAVKSAAPVNTTPSPTLNNFPITIPIAAAIPVVPSKNATALNPIDFKVSIFLNLY